MMTKFKKLFCVFVLILCLAPVMYADWNPSDGHKMHFPQLPDPCGWDIDLLDYWLADDWQCSKTDEVNDIHFWISCAKDGGGTISSIMVRIYDNDPCGPFSKPRNLLWSRTFSPSEFVVRLDPAYGDEGYWIPDTNVPELCLLYPHDHRRYSQVNIKDINDPFVQVEGQIYWLSLRVTLFEPDRRVGWKTSLDHFMDTAVIKFPWGWSPLYEPNTTMPIDFSFVITSGPNEPNYPTDAKWLQRPDLTPNGVDVKATEPLILADDFECNKTTKITDITIWGSWRNDILPPNGANDVWFTLSIHSDVPDPDPCNPLDWSMPGEVLWLKNSTIGEANVSIERQGIEEGWYDPYYYEYFFPGDTVCWKYVFHIPESEAFCQKGEPNKPIVYWLDVQAHPNDSNGYLQFGWKSSINHWNDDAVWALGSEPYTGWWNELRYPELHPLEGNSIDLAFAIEGNTPCNQGEDFGDAPDGVAAPLYPTLLINNGARHTIDGVTFMGAIVDAEIDGQPTVNADGDDLNPPASDDEDGVVIPLLLRGQAVTINVTASVPGALDAWIDYSADSSWAQAGDQIAAALPLVAGANPITFVVPATATLGQTYARFRFSTAGGLQPFGPATNGEVEDYAVYIEEPQPEKDLGDAPDSTNNFGLAMTAYPSGVVANYPTVYLDPTGLPPFGPIHLQPNVVAYLGQNVTLENEADIGPDQDPTNNIIPPTNTPDQDLADGGLLGIPLKLPYCYPTTFQYQVNVVNNAVTLYVNAWFDWNRDGDWDDTFTCGTNNAPERAVQNQLLPAGSLALGLNTITTPQFRAWHPSPLPTDANIWIRITLSEQPWVGSGSGGSGPATGYLYGETEDYYLPQVTKCLKPNIADMNEYNAWVQWGEPNCWCCRRQCRGDADCKKSLGVWVATPDLNLLKAAFNKADTVLKNITNGICADFDHAKALGVRVATPDLNTMKAYFNKPETSVPCCDKDKNCTIDCNMPPVGDRWYFWTN